jgi:hypothetical protein
MGVGAGAGVHRGPGALPRVRADVGRARGIFRQVSPHLVILDSVEDLGSLLHHLAAGTAIIQLCEVGEVGQVPASHIRLARTFDTTALTAGLQHAREVREAGRQAVRRGFNRTVASMRHRYRMTRAAAGVRARAGARSRPGVEPTSFNAPGRGSRSPSAWWAAGR